MRGIPSRADLTSIHQRPTPCARFSLYPEFPKTFWSYEKILELVIISGMIVQKDDMAMQISKAKQRGLPVAVGGPFASSTPDVPELDLADFKILD